MRKKKEANGNELRRKRRPVCCPECGWRIMDAAVHTKIKLILPDHGAWPDFVLKCGHCGRKIGIRKTE